MYYSELLGPVAGAGMESGRELGAGGAGWSMVVCSLGVWLVVFYDCGEVEHWHGKAVEWYSTNMWDTKINQLIYQASNQSNYQEIKQPRKQSDKQSGRQVSNQARINQSIKPSIN